MSTEPRSPNTLKPNFELDRPAECAQDANNVLHETRVGGVRKSIAKPAAVADVDREAGSERLDQAIRDATVDADDLAVLGAGVHRLADPGPVRDHPLRSR